VKRGCRVACEAGAEDAASADVYSAEHTLRTPRGALAAGLQFCDSSVGSGAVPRMGQMIKAHYTGRLTDGRMFDSSYTRGKPLQFKVGVHQVISGWDEGILGGAGIPPMKVGGKRMLVVPAALGYGDRGAGVRTRRLFILRSHVVIWNLTQETRVQNAIDDLACNIRQSLRGGRADPGRRHAQVRRRAGGGALDGRACIAFESA